VEQRRKSPSPAQTSEDEDPLLSPDQLAEYTGIKKAVWAQLRYMKTGPKYIKPSPRKILYRKSRVDEWLKQQEQ